MSSFSDESFIFRRPERAIFNERDLSAFQKSACYLELIKVVQLVIYTKDCAENVKSLKISDCPPPNPVITKLDAFMSILEEILDSIPPIQQPMRFGNKAFRIWHDRLAIETEIFLIDILPPAISNSSVEISPYILDMFGNTTRIDYGTGHELNFVILIYLLLKLKIIERSDLPAAILVGFVSYIRVMRKLQTVYMLEPAGSHGVWGLDDYHCLLFLFGSAQLSAQKEIKPSDIHDKNVLASFSSEYLYLEGISFIRAIKSSAPFSETSPMLNDISGISDWAKICSGLMQLFKGEVLHKLPVVQHVLFGSILKATW